jgi:hypothetical protein
MRSFFPLLSINPATILAVVDVAASRTSGQHALSVHYGIFPSTEVAYYRVSERLLLENRPRSGDSDHQWHIDFHALECIMREVACPFRVLAYVAADGGQQYRLLIPPDTKQPKAVRWRILCTGILMDELLEKFKEMFPSAQRDKTWSQAMVPLKSPIIFAGEKA